MNFGRAPAKRPASSPTTKTSRKHVPENVDQTVPWYGRLLIAGVMIGATIEFFRLLLAIVN